MIVLNRFENWKRFLIPQHDLFLKNAAVNPVRPVLSVLQKTVDYVWIVPAIAVHPADAALIAGRECRQWTASMKNSISVG